MALVEVRGSATTLHELEQLCELARQHDFDGNDAIGRDGVMVIIQHEVRA